jgi:predicted nucleic-acid-binding protein
MIGLDTNVLVRYFAQDDLKQSTLVNRVMSSLTKDQQGFISLPVLCELIWVLEDLYDVKKLALTEILQTLFEAVAIEIEQKPLAWRALNRYRNHNCDFSDALIAEIGSAAGCQHTLSFDKAAAKAGLFELLR